MSDWLQQSNHLHEQVQAFIASTAAPDEHFEPLALSIARFQAQHVPAYARLVQARGAHLDSIEDIPAVPVEVFRMTRIACHPSSCDAVRFLTSGTTSGERGQHCMRRTDTYRAAALAWGRQALIPEGFDRATVICLAPRPEPEPSSSLGFMLQAFLEDFDPESLRDDARRWLLSPSGVDLDGLLQTLESALRRTCPILLLATSFALVHMLDALGGRRLPTDNRLIVMPTGGFKGKSRELRPDELLRAIAETFAIDEQRIVGEYGMTELSSQLYEGTLPGARLHGPRGWYVPPPWLRVDAVDPTSLAAMPEGQVGLASFIDLANVDSAVRILTQDQIVRHGSAVRLLGRVPTAAPRGCSLGDEELLQVR